MVIGYSRALKLIFLCRGCRLVALPFGEKPVADFKEI